MVSWHTSMSRTQRGTPVGKIVSKIRQARLAYAVKQGKSVPLSKVADDLGINRVVLTRIELGQADASYEQLAKLCEYYGVSIEDLIEYDPNKSPVGVSAFAFQG
jgi:transcriptional regulator with XRE-family HTH domain